MTRTRKLSAKRLLFAGIPLCLFLSILLASSWLLFSGAGARWLWAQLEGATGNALSAREIEGDLASGLTIYGLQYKTPALVFSAETTRAKALPGLWPFSIKVQELFMQGVTIHQLAIENTRHSADDPLDISALVDALSLPIPLYVDHGKMVHVEYWQIDPEPAGLIDSMDFSLAMDENMAINNLVLNSQDLDVQGNAQLTLGPPYLFKASINGNVKPLADQAKQLQVLPFELQVDGDLEKLGFRLISSTLELDIGGDLSGLLDKPAWDLAGVIGKLPEQMPFSSGEMILSDLALTSEGNQDEWKMVLNSNLDISDLEPVEVAVTASGSLTGISFQRATVNGTGIDIGINGLIDWSGDLQADLNAVVDQLDIGPWLQEWPEGLYLQGQLDLNWSEDGLKIPASQLTVPGTGFSASVRADIDWQTGLVDAQLDWADFYWPLNQQEHVFDSRSGRLDIRGSVEQWSTSGDLELKVGDYPAGRFSIEGEGNRESAHTRLLQGDVLGGQLSGSFEVDWMDELKWALDLNARAIDPEPIFPGWPGRLDGDFRVASDGPSMPVNIQLDSLQGILRGTPIDAAGKFGIADDHAWFEQLVVNTELASLRLDGNSLEREGVSADFSGQLPSMLLKGASGSLEMQARFSNYQSSPVLGMQMQALDFAFNDLGIKSIEFSSTAESAGTAISALDLNATGLRWKDEIIDELSVSVRGQEQGFHLQASMASELLDLAAGIEMAPEDTENLLKGRWTGLLTSVDLIIGKKLNFSLANPSTMSWSDGAFSLAATCLNETGGAGVCAGMERDAIGNLVIEADITTFPVDYLRQLYELDMKFEQTLDGHLEWHQSIGRRVTGGADVRITAGQVVDLIDNEPLLESSEGQLKFNLRDGNLESGIVDIDFPGVGFIDVEFEVADIIDENGRRLTGRVVSQLNNIELVGQLAFPGVDEVNGQFNSNIRLGGTLLDPEFDGGFSLTDGLFHYQPTGLKLEDVQFTGKVDSHDRGSVRGQFRAGEGVGVIEGRFLFENPENMKLDLNLSGEKLLLINTQTLKMSANPKLDIGVSPKRLDIDGSILVPMAYLTPETLLLETVSDSEDLVIETRGTETPNTGKNKDYGMRVFGSLEIAFGDDVRVKVPGIDGAIHGSVKYSWNGNFVPMAEGSYIVNGSVDFYGPTLSITNGSIGFPGVRANNPVLNIRAQRDIFGNTQIRSAGVQVIGTLKRPVLEAFTVPVTNEDRAWALLVTGSDFDQSQGVGGFDVGTYIAPRLYVSYGISLFERENVISARYDLNKGFGIKVTSGQRETGVDISYTIDR